MSDGFPWTFHDGRAEQKGRVAFISGASVLPVSVDELKKHLRINPDQEDEDKYLQGLIESALDEIDMPRAFGHPPGWLGRSLITRTLRLTLDAPPPIVVYLPGSPVTSIVTVEFRDHDDNFITIAPTEFITDLTREPALVWADVDWPFNVQGWPEAIKGGPDTFRITYVAGYADKEAVPSLIKQWVMIRAAELYRDREGTVIGTITSTLKHIERMLDNYRVR